MPWQPDFMRLTGHHGSVGATFKLLEAGSRCGVPKTDGTCRDILSVAERSFSLLDRVKMFVKPMP